MKKYVIAPALTLVAGGIFEALGYIISGSFGLGAVPAVIVMGTFILAALEKGKKGEGEVTDAPKGNDKETKLLVDALEKRQK